MTERTPFPDVSPPLKFSVFCSVSTFRVSEKSGIMAGLKLTTSFAIRPAANVYLCPYKVLNRLSILN